MKTSFTSLTALAFIALLAAAFAATDSEACYASCTGCTCHGMCGQSQYCSGVGPDCYCSGSLNEIKDPNHKIAGQLIRHICSEVHNMSIPFIVPVQNQHDTGVLIKCSHDREFMAHIV